jgi:hypothetical protein
MLVVSYLVPSMLHLVHYTANARTLRGVFGSGVPICRDYAVLIGFGTARFSGS